MLKRRPCADSNHTFEGRYDRVTLPLDDGPYSPGDFKTLRPINVIYVGDICSVIEIVYG